MTLPLIPTTIIGSLPKPAWLAADWYSIAGNWRLSGEALREAQDDATRLAVAEQLNAGIDILCDGEQRRPTHHTYFLTQLDGVDFATLKPKTVRAGKLTQDVPRVIGPLALHGSSRAKIPSPQPPSFLPACLGFAPKTFRRDGGTENKREDKRGITLAPPTRARVISNVLPNFV